MGLRRRERSLLAGDVKEDFKKELVFELNFEGWVVCEEGSVEEAA